MKPKGHKVLMKERRDAAAKNERWKAMFAGLDDNEQIKKRREVLGVEYHDHFDEVDHFKEDLPWGYHAYLETLRRFPAAMRWSIGIALHELMDVISHRDFTVKIKVKAKCIDIKLTVDDLQADLNIVRNEPPDMQLRIIRVLPVLWTHFKPWRCYQSAGRAKALEKAEKKSKQIKAVKGSDEKVSDARMKRHLHLEDVFQSAALDEKGHTAPIDPHPAWLLNKAREQVPKPWPLGFIWDMAKLKIEDRLTWPSIHDLVMGLAMRRKEIIEEIAAHREPWHMPPDTSPDRPGRSVRYSPECLRWLITRWLKREHPELENDEEEHSSNFLRHILENLPK